MKARLHKAGDRGLTLFARFSAWATPRVERFRAWFNADFMVLTWRRLAIALVLVALYSSMSDAVVKRYYAADDMPIPFRNMDMSNAWETMRLYMEGQGIGPDTYLVLGDCVAYGNGSAKSFTHYMSVPGRKVINVSMHSFNYDLLYKTLDYAAQKGVKNVMVQIHPFHNYRKDANEWQQMLEAVRPGATVENTDVDTLTALAAEKWRGHSVWMGSTQETYAFHQGINREPLLDYSVWLRADVASHIPLYRNRYALDDALGLDASFYSFMAKRRDAFFTPLPEKRQEEIFTSEAMNFLWNQFVIRDKPEFRRAMFDYSPQARLAKYAQDKGVNLVFMMVPTMLEKTARYTLLSEDDLLYANRVFRDVARKYGAGYLDYLDDRRFDAYMYHYDNLTVEGHKVLGEVISAELPAVLNRKGRPQ